MRSAPTAVAAVLGRWRNATSGGNRVPAGRGSGGWRCRRPSGRFSHIMRSARRPLFLLLALLALPLLAAPVPRPRPAPGLRFVILVEGPPVSRPGSLTLFAAALADRLGVAPEWTAGVRNRVVAARAD